MISDDLANLADRMSGYALHGTVPPPTEFGCIAAELLKISHIVKTMEGLPLDYRMLQILEPVPEWHFVRSKLGTQP